jgi:hypothetical protein
MGDFFRSRQRVGKQSALAVGSKRSGMSQAEQREAQSKSKLSPAYTDDSKLAFKEWARIGAAMALPGSLTSSMTTSP